MLTIRRAAERGHANHGWLDSFHTFSFADYHDPAHTGFRALRVINEDRVQPAKGFGTHAHRDMEIVSYVLEGALAHKDSLGTGSTIVPGDVQRMSAGTGVTHSEFNASREELVHFLQIWIVPDRAGHKPSYEQTHFDEGALRGRLCLIASPDGVGASVTLHADALLYVSLLGKDNAVKHTTRPGRHTWIHVAKGTVRAGTIELQAGDAASTSEPGEIVLSGTEAGGEVIVFDLA